MTVSLFLYAFIVIALLVAELREDRRAQFFFKPLAAFGFVLLALQFGALETFYGKYILAGLIACAMGDVFLLARKSQPLFILGMLAFIAGHIFYGIGFFDSGLYFYPDYVEPVHRPILTPTIIILAISIPTAIYFIKRVSPFMKIAIGLYTFIIVCMVSLSFLLGLMVISAALMFAISDMFVARDRFIKRDSINALAITPLYFGAQALFAFSTAI